MTTETQQKRCTQCGATTDVPQGIVSHSCSYCDAPVVDVEVAEAKVDRVAPFRLPLETAETKLAEHLKNRWWAPEAVRKGLVQEHKVRGVLVPFQAYNGTARSQYNASIGIHWYRTETYVDSKGNTKTRVKQETEWFDMNGSAILALDDHLVSASVGMPEESSNALEPFDTGRAIPFSPELVAGWEAELPSINREQTDQTAVSEVRDGEAKRIDHYLLPGDVGSLNQINTEIDLERVDTVWLPVWMASYRHGEKVYQQFVNGQTGKYVGEAPTSWVKVVAAVFVALGALALMAMGID